VVSSLNNLLANVRSDNGTNIDRQSDTATLFSQGLKRGLGLGVKPSPENDPGDKVFDIQKVVDTVAGFIEQRLASRRDEGASQDELNDLIAQAREGVSKGFQLARDDIARIDRMTPDLGSNIDAAESGINARIDQLEDQIKPVDEGVLSNITSSAYTQLTDRQSFQRSEARFDFELTTQEGDRIQVSAQELFQRSERFSSIESGGASASRFSSSTSYTSGYSISVNGNLNEDEIAALDSLLQQVTELSDTFYEGDISQAFNQALSLEFDSTQIAQFSLDLSTSRVSVLEQTDIQTNQFSKRVPAEYRAPQIPTGIQTLLTDYAEQLEQLLDAAQEFSDKLALKDSGASLVKQLYQGFEQSVGRGDLKNDFLGALLDGRS